MRSPIAAVMLLAALIAGGAGLVLWFVKDKNYEECMISEMKGQDRLMYPTVDKLCSRRFKKEVYISTHEAKISFYVERGLARITVDESPDHIVERLKVRFAPKDCSNVKSDDWRPYEQIKIIGGNSGSTFLPKSEDSGKHCMQTSEIYGLYK